MGQAKSPDLRKDAFWSFGTHMVMATGGILARCDEAPRGSGPLSHGSVAERIWKDHAGDLRTPSSADADSRS